MLTPFPRTAFAALVATLANIPASYVTWRGNPAPPTGKPGGSFSWASIEIASKRRVGIGYDNIIRTDLGNGSFSVIQTGRRQIHLEFKIFTYDAAALVFADDVADSVASGLFEGTSLAVLNGMALAIEDTGDILPLPTTIGGRFISAAYLEVTVALGVIGSYTYPGGNTWIDEAIGTGTITTENGGTVTQTADVKSTVHP